MVNRDELKETIEQKINDFYKDYAGFDKTKTDIDIINNFYVTIWLNNKPQIVSVAESDWILKNKDIEEISDRVVFDADLNFKNANTFKK